MVITFYAVILGYPENFLLSVAMYGIFRYIKEQPPTRGWPVIEIAMPPGLVKVQGWLLLCILTYYLQNVNTNVSNAKRNRPKVIISLKSK